MDMWLFSLCAVSIICLCACSSYWRGRDEGIGVGIEKSLSVLVEQKVIYLDNNSEIYQYDSDIGKAARKLDKENTI